MKDQTLRVLIDILHDPYVVGLYSHLDRHYRALHKIEGGSFPTLSHEIESLSIMGFHILGLTLWKVPGSRRQVHPLYVVSEVDGVRRKTGNFMTECYLGSDDNREGRIDIHYSY